MSAPHVYTSPQLIVTIGGNVIPLCFVDSAIDGIAPEVGSASLTIPLGGRWYNGMTNSVDPVINIRDAVVITSSDGTYSWIGEVAVIERKSQQPYREWTVTCQGDAAAFQRAMLSTWRAITYYGTPTPFQTYRSVDLNDNENADMSPITYPVGGLSINVTDTYSNGRKLWNQSQAITAILGVAIADAGLPATTLKDLSGLMTKENTWRIGQKSVFAMLGEVIGARSDSIWYIGRDNAGNRVINVQPARGGGKAIDLTVPNCINSSHITDGRATLYGMRYVGSRQQFITTVTLFPGSTGGNLIPDWTADDEDDANFGDKNSPAFRRYLLDPSIPLPDGTTAGNARLIGGIPMQVVSLSGRTLYGGPGYSGSAIAMYQDSNTGAWISLDGQVTITRRGDANGVWIDGGKWLDVYDTAYRVSFTVAMESVQQSAISNTGGAGKQWGFVNANSGQVCVIDSGTYLGVNNGTVVTAAPEAFRNDLPKMQDVLDANWEWYEADLCSINAQFRGVFSVGFNPGDVVSQATLWGGDGTTVDTLLVNSCITRRIASWNQAGAMLRLTSTRLPPNLSAIAGS